MRSNIVLIDFENVQPDALDELAHEHFRVLVFVGASQGKLPFDVVASIQRLGNRAEYIRISGNGSNALDFHIAYYIGLLSAADSTAYFHIVSRDTGFDPLIAHLKARKIFAGRVESVTEIPVVKATGKKAPEERVEVVLEKLRKSKSCKPRTVKTLSSTISSLFQKLLSDEEIAAVVQGLVKRRAITIDGTKVTYAAGDDA